MVLKPSLPPHKKKEKKKAKPKSSIRSNSFPSPSYALLLQVFLISCNEQNLNLRERKSLSGFCFGVSSLDNSSVL